MKRSMFLLSLVTLCLPAVAQETKPAAPKMSAAAILDKYIEVTGGKAAYEKSRSSSAKGTMTITGQNIKGTIEIQQKAPNKMYMVQTFEGIGKTEIVFDGKNGWTKDPLQGIRTLTGKELEQIREEAVFNAPLKWRELYTKTEVVGVRPVAGQDAYAVRLTPKTGKPTIQFYDTQTFLLVRIDAVQESPQGSIPVESYVSDYRIVDGVKTPFKLRQRIAASEIVTEFTEIKNNPAVPDSLFTKPKEK